MLTAFRGGKPLRRRLTAVACGLIALLLTVTACGTTTTAGPSGSTTPSTSPTGTGTTVKVFFSKHPDSDNDFTNVFSVNRTAPDLAVATYAVPQLIAGPTAAEQQAGYFTELTAVID